MKNLDAFMAEYEKQLQIAVDTFPDEYPWAHKDEVTHGNLGKSLLKKKTVPEVGQSMRKAIETNSFSHDGRAFKATCKALGIKHTQKAIREFVNREPSQ